MPLSTPQTGAGRTEPGRTELARTELVRALARWSLAALAVNSVIGSGIFGLPSTVAGFIGKSSVVAVLMAGVAMAVIMGCFAEVASQFSAAGGPYLYARTAFGRLMGILVGWTLYSVADRGARRQCQSVCRLSCGILAAREGPLAPLLDPDRAGGAARAH